MIDRLFKTLHQQLLDIMREKMDPSRQSVLMLSGGIDSLIVLALYDSMYGAKDNLHTVTLVGTGETERKNARMFATHFHTRHEEVTICLNDLMNLITMIKGKKFTTVFQAMFYIMMKISVTKVDVKDKNLIHGGGADALQGTQSPFLFVATNDVADRLNCTAEEARDYLRKEDYKKKRAKLPSSAAYIRESVYKKTGANIVDPFNDPRLAWLVDLPTSVIRPKNKGFFKDFLHKELKVPDVSKVKRMDLQSGSGLYPHFKLAIENIPGNRGRNANAIIKELSL